jgi:hypothetical protein
MKVIGNWIIDDDEILYAAVFSPSFGSGEQYTRVTFKNGSVIEIPGTALLEIMKLKEME